jgi:hypothetical protein
MMPPQEYIKQWTAILAAADSDDDKTFWKLYSDFLKVSTPISRERMALLKMAQRAAQLDNNIHI